MSFWQNVALGLIGQTGGQVPPQMMAELQAKAARNQNAKGVKGVLNRLPFTNSLQLPTPPTPPKDSNDIEAQKKYNQALLDYNQRFQSYHTQMMQVFMQRFTMMQQAILQAQRSRSVSPSSTGSLSGGISPSINATGGILGGDS